MLLVRSLFGEAEVTAPVYVDVSDFEDYLAVSTGWETDLLSRALLAAEAKVEEFCGRTFVDSGTVEARTFRARSTHLVVIDDVQAVSLVETSTGGRSGSWTTFVSTDIVEETYGPAGSPVQVLEADYGHFPVGRQGWVRVTPAGGAGWGWAAVPAAVPAAVLLQAAKIYNRKESPAGLVVGLQGQALMSGPAEGLDSTAASLLEGLRRADQWLP
tara:strand:+ start:6967 stop:7608 length:642 start_codon:yes stop_codon:yes gene_type:complete